MNFSEADIRQGLNGAALPETFADMLIRYRIPYQMPGELLVDPNTAGNVFPEATFLHNQDKPFEIWRMITRLTPLNTDTDPSTILGPVLNEGSLYDDLARRIRLSLTDTSKNERITKNPTLLSTLQRENQRSWEWHVPYTLVRQEQIQVAVDALAFPLVIVNEAADGVASDSISRQVDQVRVEISFQGYLLILEPPHPGR